MADFVVCPICAEPDMRCENAEAILAVVEAARKIARLGEHPASCAWYANRPCDCDLNALADTLRALDSGEQK